MKVTYFDLIPGFEFVAPGVGQVKYCVDRVIKQIAYCTRTRQNGEESARDLSTDTILHIINKEK